MQILSTDTKIEAKRRASGASYEARTAGRLTYSYTAHAADYRSPTLPYVVVTPLHNAATEEILIRRKSGGAHWENPPDSLRLAIDCKRRSLTLNWTEGTMTLGKH